MALLYEQHRRMEGEEAFPATIDVLNESIADLGLLITAEEYERKFRKFWPEHRPHVDFNKLPTCQKEIISRMDPDYVARRMEEAERRITLEKIL